VVRFEKRWADHPDREGEKTKERKGLSPRAMRSRYDTMAAASSGWWDRSHKHASPLIPSSCPPPLLLITCTKGMQTRYSPSDGRIARTTGTPPSSPPHSVLSTRSAPRIEITKHDRICFCLLDVAFSFAPGRRPPSPLQPTPRHAFLLPSARPAPGPRHPPPPLPRPRAL